MPVNDVFDVQVVVVAFLGLASTSAGAERVSARTTVRSFMVWCPCPMDIPVRISLPIRAPDEAAVNGFILKV